MICRFYLSRGPLGSQRVKTYLRQWLTPLNYKVFYNSNTRGFQFYSQSRTDPSVAVERLKAPTWLAVNLEDLSSILLRGRPMTFKALIPIYISVIKQECKSRLLRRQCFRFVFDFQVNANAGIQNLYLVSSMTICHFTSSLVASLGLGEKLGNSQSPKCRADYMHEASWHVAIGLETCRLAHVSRKIASYNSGFNRLIRIVYCTWFQNSNKLTN